MQWVMSQKNPELRETKAFRPRPSVLPAEGDTISISEALSRPALCSRRHYLYLSRLITPYTFLKG